MSTDDLKALSDAEAAAKDAYQENPTKQHEEEMYVAMGKLSAAVMDAYRVGELVPADAIEAFRADAVAKCEKWMNNDHITLHAGEMTAQELRSVKAVVGAIARSIRSSRRT